MNKSRLLCALLPMLALSCADSGGPVLVDAEWNLSCPSGSGVACGSWLQETCIGDGGQRAIVGEHGQPECSDRIIATCEAVERSGGVRDITIEANVDRNGGSSPRFAFQLSVQVDGGDGSVDHCNVAIIENEVLYDVAMTGSPTTCGEEPPSLTQPCQLSNVSTEGNEVVFDLECDSLVNSTTGFAWDVGALGDGPTTIRFANCTGF